MSEIENRDGEARLERWLGEAGCASGRVDELYRVLRWPVECAAGAWSASVASAASAILQERARLIWRRQVGAFVVAALVALPLAAALGVVGLRLAYDLLCGVLPASLATYVVSTYAMVAFGIVGLTYAMIPLVIGRSHDRLVLAQSWAARTNPAIRSMESLR